MRLKRFIRFIRLVWRKARRETMPVGFLLYTGNVMPDPDAGKEGDCYAVLSPSGIDSIYQRRDGFWHLLEPEFGVPRPWRVDASGEMECNKCGQNISQGNLWCPVHDLQFCGVCRDEHRREFNH